MTEITLKPMSIELRPEIKYVKGKIRRTQEGYKRTDYDTVRTYKKYTDYYIRKMTESPEVAMRSVIDANKRLHKDPTVLYFNKDRTTYDTHSDTIPLSEYHKRTITENNTMGGSGTTYVHKSIEESVPSKMMNVNKKARAIEKGKAFQCKAGGDSDGFAIHNRSQINKKLSNNSLSGVVGILSSFLYCPSLHPTLTSTTRLTTSIANNILERLLGSNRNYHSFEYTIQDIISICCDAEDRREEIESIVKKYSLHIPTPGEMLGVVLKSARDYWVDTKRIKDLTKFISTLTDIERIAYCYTGDFWYLTENNEKLMRDFFRSMINESKDVPAHSALEIANKYDDYQQSLAAHFLSSDLKGKGTNYNEMEPELVCKIAGKIENSVDRLESHMDLFRCFLSTDHIPPNVSDVKTMVRKSVPMSDTDSCAMWLGRFMKWYSGTNAITDDTYAVLGIMSYIAVITVDHNLRMLSSNMGVAKEDFDILEMKSEFTWTALCFVNITKHYYASATVIEANVLDDMVVETKGVHLKSSSLPQFILDGSEKLKRKILDAVTTGGDLNLKDIINEVCAVEDYIEERVHMADTSVLKLMQIKDTNSYANIDPARNNSKHWHFWEDVFSEKYEYNVDIPFTAVKFNLKFKNKSGWIDYLVNIKDESIRDKLIEYVGSYMASEFPKIFYIPLEYASQKGIPEELVDAIDVDTIILDLCNIYYIILSSLKYVVKHNTTVRDVVRNN